MVIRKNLINYHLLQVHFYGHNDNVHIKYKPYKHALHIGYMVMLDMPSNLAAVPMKMVLITPLYKRVRRETIRKFLCNMYIHFDILMNEQEFAVLIMKETH